MSSTPKLSVTLNPETLIVNLNYEGSSPKVINDLILLLSNNYPELQNYADQIFLPWHDFKNNLVHIGHIAKTNGVQLAFDELSLRLIKEYIDDRNKLRLSSNPSTQTLDIQALLNQASFNRNLKSEQIRDVSSLLKLKHGANFSVPGAGKTATLLAVHTILKSQGIISKLFVVCPINAFISWEDEIKSIFQQKLKVQRLSSSLLNNFGEILRISPDVLLVNYEKLRKENSGMLSYFLTNNIHLILDESHRIKGGNNNLSYSLISKLSDLAKRRDVLSGTPMPQSYLDLQPQFDLLWPGEEIIPDTINGNEDTKIERINSAIKDLYVRTTKNELHLRDPEIIYTKISLGTIQRQLYQLFKSEAARTIAGMNRVDLINFRKIGKSVVRLLQAATNPMLLGLQDDFYEETLPVPENSNIWELLDEFVKYEKPKKIEYLQERVKNILSTNKENKIVIWSYFVRNIQLLERIFANYNPVSIYGGIGTGSDEDENNREGRIKKFHNEPSCRLMIANPQACGEGISLHKVCHYAIYLDRNFNAAHFLQSIDRIHRLGLSDKIDTKVEILVAEGTIDEVLIQRLNEKILNMGKILDDKYLQTLAYDPADIALDENGIDNKDLVEIKRHILED